MKERQALLLENPLHLAAEVEPGDHTYEMQYEPAGLKIGIIISFATFVILIVYLFAGRKILNRRYSNN